MKKNPDHVAFVERPPEEWRLTAKDKIYKGVFVEVRSLFPFPVPTFKPGPNPADTRFPSHSRLVRPDIISNLPHKLKLVDHAIPVNSIALTVRSETTLRADTDLVESLLEGNVVTLSDELGGIDNALLHLLLVLHGGELASHDAEDDVLVAGQVLEGLEAAGALGVVLQVVGVDVELLEQLDGNAVVSTLGEVAATDEVAAAQVNTNVHVLGQTDEAVVVLLDILLEHVVGAVHVERVLLEAAQELLRAEV